MVNFKFYLKDRSAIEIKIYDIMGRMVKRLYKDIAQKGENCLMFNQFVLSSGTYFVQIQSNGKIIQREKLVVIR